MKSRSLYTTEVWVRVRGCSKLFHIQTETTWPQLLFDHLMLQIAERWTPAEGWIEVPSQSIHLSSVCVSVRNGRKGHGLQAIFLPEKVSFSALPAPIFSVAQGCRSSCNQWEAELSRDVVSWETGGFASLRHREKSQEPPWYGRKCPEGMPSCFSLDLAVGLPDFTLVPSTSILKAAGMILMKQSSDLVTFLPQTRPTTELMPKSLQCPFLIPDPVSHFSPLLLQPTGLLAVSQTLRAPTTSGPLHLLVPQPEMLFQIPMAHSCTVLRSLLECH